MSIDFNSIFKNWKSVFITRNQLFEISGGLLHPKTMRNLDSIGKGISGKFSVGRKVAYPIENVAAFLASKYKPSKEVNSD